MACRSNKSQEDGVYFSQEVQIAKFHLGVDTLCHQMVSSPTCSIPVQTDCGTMDQLLWILDIPGG